VYVYGEAYVLTYSGLFFVRWCVSADCSINVHDSCTFKDQSFPCVSYQTTGVSSRHVTSSLTSICDRDFIALRRDVRVKWTPWPRHDPDCGSDVATSSGGRTASVTEGRWRSLEVVLISSTLSSSVYRHSDRIILSLPTAFYKPEKIAYSLLIPFRCLPGDRVNASHRSPERGGNVSGRGMSSMDRKWWLRLSDCSCGFGNETFHFRSLSASQYAADGREAPPPVQSRAVCRAYINAV